MTGGFWNRAGRRSGGNRPTVITIPPTLTCAACQTETAFGLLTQRIVHSTLIRCCPKCDGVLLVKVGQRWITATEFEALTAGGTP